MVDLMRNDVMPAGRLLTASEVAALFNVNRKTVSRWGKAGLLGSIRTPGGHRRFRESEVRDLLTRDGPDVAAPSVGAPPGRVAWVISRSEP